VRLPREINYPNKVRYKEAYKSRSLVTLAKLDHGISFVKSRGRERAPLAGFDKKFHNRPGQKVNYLNALSDARFDKVSYERDSSSASHYGAETNADVRVARNIRPENIPARRASAGQK